MTVRPDDINLAGRVDFSRGQDTRANAPSRRVEGHRGNFIRLVPVRSTVSGREGQDVAKAARKTLDWHDHGPARLHQRLPTNAVIVGVGRQGSSPGLATVG